MIGGGIASGFGIENPKRQPANAYPTRGAAAAGECGHGSDADCHEQEKARAATEPA
jgi:hypothetical protein